MDWMVEPIVEVKNAHNRNSSGELNYEISMKGVDMTVCGIRYKR